MCIEFQRILFLKTNNLLVIYWLLMASTSVILRVVSEAGILSNVLF